MDTFLTVGKTEQRCVNCARRYDEASNHADACSFHPGEKKADLATFNAMRRVPRDHRALGIIMDGIDDDGPWWYWTCCNAGIDTPGCRRGPHQPTT